MSETPPSLRLISRISSFPKCRRRPPDMPAAVADTSGLATGRSASGAEPRPERLVEVANLSADELGPRAARRAHRFSQDQFTAGAQATMCSRHQPGLAQLLTGVRLGEAGEVGASRRR